MVVRVCGGGAAASRFFLFSRNGQIFPRGVLGLCPNAMYSRVYTYLLPSPTGSCKSVIVINNLISKLMLFRFNFSLFLMNRCSDSILIKVSIF